MITTADATATEIRHHGYDSLPRSRGNLRRAALSSECAWYATIMRRQIEIAP